jgi:hypothetical protein
MLLTWHAHTVFNIAQVAAATQELPGGQAGSLTLVRSLNLSNLTKLTLGVRVYDDAGITVCRGSRLACVKRVQLALHVEEDEESDRCIVGVHAIMEDKCSLDHVLISTNSNMLVDFANLQPFLDRLPSCVFRCRKSERHAMNALL